LHIINIIIKPKAGNFGENAMYERILIDPNICHGQACIKNTRIPVHQVVHMLANGDTIEELLKEYPSLNRDDILACLDYAASLAEEQITPIEG
jgi:uncharacterized protein (DUF433 family)